MNVEVQNVYKSRSPYCMFFIVAHTQNPILASAVRDAVPGTVHCYMALCGQNEVHYHGILVTTYAYTTKRIAEIVSGLCKGDIVSATPIYKGVRISYYYIDVQVLYLKGNKMATVFNADWEYNAKIPPFSNPWNTCNGLAMFRNMDALKVSQYWVSMGMPRYAVPLSMDDRYFEKLKMSRLNFINRNSAVMGRISGGCVIEYCEDRADAVSRAYDKLKQMTGCTTMGVYTAYDDNVHYLDEPIAVCKIENEDDEKKMMRMYTGEGIFTSVRHIFAYRVKDKV